MERTHSSATNEPPLGEPPMDETLTPLSMESNESTASIVAVGSAVLELSGATAGAVTARDAPRVSGTTNATTSDTPDTGPTVPSTVHVATVDGTAWLRLPNGDLINPKNTLASHSVVAGTVTPSGTAGEDTSEFLAAMESSTIRFSAVGDAVLAPPRVVGGADMARHDDATDGMTDSGITSRSSTNGSPDDVASNKESLEGVSEFDVPEGGGTSKPANGDASHATSSELTTTPPDSSPVPFTPPVQPHSNTEEMLHAILVDDTNGQHIQLAEIVSNRWIRWVAGAVCVILVVAIGAVWSRWPSVGSNMPLAQETAPFVPITASPVPPPVSVPLPVTKAPNTNLTLEDRSDRIVQFINNITLTNSTLSPDYELSNIEEYALAWLVEDNVVLDTPEAQFRVKQRYALATLVPLDLGYAFDDAVYPSPNSNECKWAGVTCTNTSVPGVIEVQPTVTGINLSRAVFSGILSPEVGLLSNLVHFDASGSSLSGSLPMTIGMLSNMQHFDMSFNSMSGVLPETIGEWSKVEYFAIQGNQMASSLPYAIGLWTNLQHFDCSSNDLSGPLFDTMKPWKGIRHLNVNSNQLTGTVPKWIGQWTNVTYFNVGDNNLTGTLPEAMGKCTNLQYCNTSVNDIDGTCTEWNQSLAYSVSIIQNVSLATPFSYPTLQQTLNWMMENSLMMTSQPNTPRKKFYLQQRYGLSTIYAQQGQPVEPVTAQTFHCEWMGVNCTWMDIGGGIGNVSVVTAIEWSGLGWTGRMVSDLGLLSHLEWFDVWDNELTGTLPSSVGLWTNLEWFDVGNNQLTGSLPESIGLWTHLEVFLVDSTQLTGSLPDSIGFWTNLVYFDVQYNQWNGSLPESIGNWTNLEWFNVGGNQLTGSLPDSIGNWTNLVYFSVFGNQLTGSLPSSIESWTNLENSYVSINQLTGSLPESIGNWTNLKVFTVGDNQLTHSLPDSIGKWTNLEYFDVDWNQLTGTLPESIASWTNLEYFEVYDNDLNGTLPDSIGNWTSLIQAFFHGNNFTGSVPIGLCSAVNLTEILVDCGELECSCDECTDCS